MLKSSVCRKLLVAKIKISLRQHFMGEHRLKTQERLRGERLVGLSHSVAAKVFRRSRGSSAPIEDSRLASPKVSLGDGYALSSGRDGREGVFDRTTTREWILGKLTCEREHRWLPFDPSWP